ncbi:H-type lectin domain-containing protein [Halovulum sp. GXIMD14794]
MATAFTSGLHIFSVDDITVTFGGLTLGDDSSHIDEAGAIMAPIVDKDGNELYGIDNEFGFYVTDFLGAEQKVLDGDFAEGHAGNILNDLDPSIVEGLAIKNAETDIFLSGLPLGTWALGLGGQTVKASTEHYVTMQQVLSDAAFPGDPDAIRPLDDDLRLRDLFINDSGDLVEGLKHDMYVRGLTVALQRAINNAEDGLNPQTYTDIDFDRDGVKDAFTTLSVDIDYDSDGDGTVETVTVGGIDLDDDGIADIVDSPLNGLGEKADLVDLLEPNESTVLSDIAYGQDYSVTLKDDGKLLYRWGTAVKRPNDIRMEVNLDLPDEWTLDEDENGIADSLEEGSRGFVVTRAELVIRHDITNNPNDQVRPEDYENEAAIGRLPSYYVVQDPDDATNTLWVSPVDSFDGQGTALPSYFKLTAGGEIDLAASGIAVYDPNGVLVGYRNEDEGGNPIGTVLRDMALAAKNASAGLKFTSGDLEAGFTAAWYTSVDREPFEWSYDKFADDPYKQVFESFRSPEEAAVAGYTEDDLVSGPRWRLTPNKFGQDLPGLEVPLEENTSPPYQKDNIKYETGVETTTRLNLLDWADDSSPLGHSSGWMLVDTGRLDENRDGLIDEGWSAVNGTLGAGDALPTGPILSAVSPNGMNLTQNFLDTAVYVKGDRQDSAQLYDIQLELEYRDDYIGSVQMVSGLNHNEQTLSFQNGAVYNAPVVFANPATFNGWHTASVKVTEVTRDSFSVFIDEPNYLDQWHRREDVSLVAFEEGTWALDDGTVVQAGSLGLAAGATNTFHSVTFDQAFDEAPVVMAQLQTQNGTDWTIVRVDNVTTTGFDFMLQEEEAADRLHEAEVLGWAAIDAGEESGIVDWGGITAQTFAMVDSVDHTGDSFVFDPAVGHDPLVSAMITSVNGINPAVLRLTDMSSDQLAATASFKVQEEKSADPEVWHLEETVAGIAFDDNGMLFV